MDSVRVCRHCNYVLEGLGGTVAACPECGAFVGEGLFTRIMFEARRTNRTLVWTIVSLLVGGSILSILGLMLDQGWVGIVMSVLFLAVPITLFTAAMRSLHLDKHYEGAPRRSPLAQFVLAGVFAIAGSFLWVLVTAMLGLCVAMLWMGIYGLTK